MTQPQLVQRALRKLLRPLYPLYYRLLWGRRFPGHRRLEDWVGRWEALVERGDVPQPGGSWDRQYAEGRWDLMGEPVEAPRYGALAAMARASSPASSILDVGCGEGLLRHAFGATEPVRYVGVDLSHEAIERARRGSDPSDRLVVADAEQWEPDGRFDVVVLNECLYYFERPVQTALRYWRCRSPEGVLLVSMFTTPRSRAISRRLREHLPVEEEVEISTSRGTWWIAAFREGERDGA